MSLQGLPRDKFVATKLAKKQSCHLPGFVRDRFVATGPVQGLSRGRSVINQACREVVLSLLGLREEKCGTAVLAEIFCHVYVSLLLRMPRGSLVTAQLPWMHTGLAEQCFY